MKTRIFEIFLPFARGVQVTTPETLHAVPFGRPSRAASLQVVSALDDSNILLSLDNSWHELSVLDLTRRLTGKDRRFPPSEDAEQAALHFQWELLCPPTAPGNAAKPIYQFGDLRIDVRHTMLDELPCLKGSASTSTEESETTDDQKNKKMKVPLLRLLALKRVVTTAFVASRDEMEAISEEWNGREWLLNWFLHLRSDRVCDASHAVATTRFFDWHDWARPSFHGVYASYDLAGYLEERDASRNYAYVFSPDAARAGLSFLTPVLDRYSTSQTRGEQCRPLCTKARQSVLRPTLGVDGRWRNQGERDIAGREGPERVHVITAERLVAHRGLLFPLLHPGSLATVSHMQAIENVNRGFEKFFQLLAEIDLAPRLSLSEFLGTYFDVPRVWDNRDDREDERTALERHLRTEQKAHTSTPVGTSTAATSSSDHSGSYWRVRRVQIRNMNMHMSGRRSTLADVQPDEIQRMQRFRRETSPTFWQPLGTLQVCFAKDDGGFLETRGTEWCVDLELQLVKSRQTRLAEESRSSTAPILLEDGSAFDLFAILQRVVEDPRYTWSFHDRDLLWQEELLPYLSVQIGEAEAVNRSDYDEIAETRRREASWFSIENLRKRVRDYILMIPEVDYDNFH